jgi:anti-sigma-K factor RskA
VSVSGPKYCGNADTAGTYVLGALPEDEAYAFELHLSGCARCQRDIHQLSSAADALGSAVPMMAAPPELGDRIRSIVRAEAELLQAAGPAADRPEAKARAGRFSLRPRFAVASTLAAGALCGLAVGAIVLGGGGGTPRTRTISAQVFQPGVARDVSATLDVTGDHGTLNVSHFPAPPAGKVYEVWRVVGKRYVPTDALFSVNTQGNGTTPVPGSLRGVHEILVTAEPLGGSLAPTSKPIIAADTET